MPGKQVKEGVWRVEEVIGNGPLERSLIYYGPGPADTDAEEETRKQEEEMKAQRTQKAAAEAAARRVEDEEKKRKLRETAAAKKAADAAEAAKKVADAATALAATEVTIKKETKRVQRNAAPPPPQPKAPSPKPQQQQQPTPPPPPPPNAKAAADPEDDDETELKLNDGSTVPAANLEKILKKYLDAVEHVMVVGSGKEFLSCMLTLKTKGSEAAARGEDPAALGPAKDELAADSLKLAKVPFKN